MRYAISNWKMNLSTQDVLSWVEKAQKNPQVFLNPNVRVVVCPSFIHIPLLKEASSKLGFHLGSQNISLYEKGAHTGEVGAFQVKEFCRYTIIGHSERDESQSQVISKIDLAMGHDLVPIVCFANPEDATVFNKQKALLVWEDPKSISENGVYKSKPVQEIQDTLSQIELSLESSNTLIYGGSVNKENIQELSKIKSLGGVLVGNASLDFNTFADIISGL